MIWYLDSSAAIKLLVEESESATLEATIEEAAPTLIAGLLVETELRRAAHRSRLLTQQTVSAFLERINLVDMSPAVFRSAGLLPGDNLRSLDALHLAGAIQSGADALVTYDQRLAEAAREAGLTVLAPE